eukprot:TRINITY_DN54874_c0_g1_i1.p1 TRINITY_DN54874_c0_g1~~TRINITY_DN54874_c0_g1_i1.p1  ORF type:complete len:697 (-),score=98.55 TRINITY_DN54874_c0_g1_i1:164-2254(-)
MDAFFARAHAQVSEQISVASTTAQSLWSPPVREPTQEPYASVPGQSRASSGYADASVADHESVAAPQSSLYCFGRNADLRTVAQLGAATIQVGAEHVSNAARSGAEQLSVVARDQADNVSAAARSGANRLTVVAGTIRDRLREADGASRFAAAAENLMEALHNQDEDPGVRRRFSVREAWGNARLGNRTRPPSSFRMKSADQVTPCSMEIDWEAGNGERQEWSSHWHPLCSGYEAEKILPGTARNIRVRFKVQAVVKSYFILAVDRHDACSPLKCPSGDRYSEEFWFWTKGPGVLNDMIALDITFEVKGSPNECHISRVWNSARGVMQVRDYEFWPDETSRPLPRPLLEVLKAADCVALPHMDGSHKHEDCQTSTMRLVAAAKALQEERRHTLAELRYIDGQLTRQWAAVNSTQTAGAGLAVASAAALFVNPVVGMGLGVASAATSGAATAGDYLADQAMLSKARCCLNEDDLNVFALADLQEAWLRARDRANLGEGRGGAGSKPEQGRALDELSHYSAAGARVGLAVASTVFGAADTAVTAAASARAAQTAALGARTASVASKALGVAGAVVSTGLAIHGWATTKSLQALVQSKLKSISQSMLGTHRWLAAMSEYECTICLSRIELGDDVQFCKDSWHCFHSHCLHRWGEECRRHIRAPTCPLCLGSLSSKRGQLEDLVVEEMRTLITEPEVTEL